MGALTGYSTGWRRLLDPLLQALQNVPSIAWVPLFILWLGIFEASKVAMFSEFYAQACDEKAKGYNRVHRKCP